MIKEAITGKWDIGKPTNLIKPIRSKSLGSRFFMENRITGRKKRDSVDSLGIRKERAGNWQQSGNLARKPARSWKS